MDKKSKSELVELHSKSQITIPKELIDKLGLTEGDKFEIYEQEGLICIMPAVVYSNEYINKLLNDITEIKRKIITGEQPVFNSMDELIAGLESDD